MSLHFLGVWSVLEELFHVPRTHSLMCAIEGAHVGRFLLSPRRGFGMAAWAALQQWLLSISVTHLLSLFTQIWWVKPVTRLHCSAELFFSVLSTPLSSLQRGRGQGHPEPCPATLHRPTREAPQHR